MRLDHDSMMTLLPCIHVLGGRLKIFSTVLKGHQNFQEIRREAMKIS